MRDAFGVPETVVLLGGTSEIGVAIVERLVRDGARTVALAARGPERLASTADRLRALGAEVVTVAFEADEPATHEALVDDLAARLGDLDVVVAAWGVLGDQEADEIDPLAAAAVVRTNFLGAVSMLTAVGNRLKAQGHGAVVVLSSVAGERVRRSNYVYGSTKAGLDGFALGMSDALRPAGVQVTVVRPGFVHTKMTAGRKAAPLSTTPEKVAAAAVAGLAARKEVVWAPGSLRVLFAVLRHLPRALFRRLPL